MRNLKMLLYVYVFVQFVGCTTSQIPHQSDFQVKVDVVTPTPEEIVESPAPQVTPTPSPTPTATPLPKKTAPVPAVSTDLMIKSIERQIYEWKKQKVGIEDLEAQVPELIGYEQKYNRISIDDARKLTDDLVKKLKSLRVDSAFITKKIERTLLILNKAKLTPEKYTAFQGRIEKLEKPIAEGKYMLANEELTSLQEEITDPIQLESP